MRDAVESAPDAVQVGPLCRAASNKRSLGRGTIRWDSGPPSIRPFFRQHYYMDPVLTSARSQIPKYFPTPYIRNPAILVERGLPAPGRTHRHSSPVDTVSETTRLAQEHLVNALQVLPRYTYDETQQTPSQRLNAGGGTESTRQYHRRGP